MVDFIESPDLNLGISRMKVALVTAMFCSNLDNVSLIIGEFGEDDRADDRIVAGFEITASLLALAFLIPAWIFHCQIKKEEKIHNGLVDDRNLKAREAVEAAEGIGAKPGDKALLSQKHFRYEVPVYTVFLLLFSDCCSIAGSICLLASQSHLDGIEIAGKLLIGASRLLFPILYTAIGEYKSVGGFLPSETGLVGGITLWEAGAKGKAAAGTATAGAPPPGGEGDDGEDAGAGAVPMGQFP